LHLIIKVFFWEVLAGFQTQQRLSEVTIALSHIYGQILLAPSIHACRTPEKKQAWYDLQRLRFAAAQERKLVKNTCSHC
jgi:hypothetical protein